MLWELHDAYFISFSLEKLLVHILSFSHINLLFDQDSSLLIFLLSPIFIPPKRIMSSHTNECFSQWYHFKTLLSLKRTRRTHCTVSMNLALLDQIVKTNHRENLSSTSVDSDICNVFEMHFPDDQYMHIFVRQIVKSSIFFCDILSLRLYFGLYILIFISQISPFCQTGVFLVTPTNGIISR